jgi:hypothetical protein
MRTVLHEENASLRFAVGVTQPAQHVTGGGVLVWDDVPAGVIVSARVSRPVELNEVSDGGAGASPGNPANYRFELASPPGPFSASGIVASRSRKRFFATDGKGAVTPLQVNPVFAAFSPVQSGGLFQSGRKTHSLPMPGFTGVTPDLADADRAILRMRWTGTAVAGESQNARLVDPVTGAASWAPDGLRKHFQGTLLNTSIAPGSLVLQATIGGNAVLLRDDGNGRLAGAYIGASPTYTVAGQGVGVIDYASGVFVVSFGTPTTGAPDNATSIVADYEYACAYLPLDVSLQWESELQ